MASPSFVVSPPFMVSLSNHERDSRPTRSLFFLSQVDEANAGSSRQIRRIDSRAMPGSRPGCEF